jgi:hypothetical protein
MLSLTVQPFVLTDSQVNGVVQWHNAPPCATDPLGFVTYNSEQPRPESISFIQARELLVRRYKSLLRGIFGGVMVGEAVKRGRPRSALIPLDQRRKCRMVAAQNGGYKFAI